MTHSIIKNITKRVQKTLGYHTDCGTPDCCMECDTAFLDNISNNTPNSKQFDEMAVYNDEDNKINWFKGIWVYLRNGINNRRK